MIFSYCLIKVMFDIKICATHVGQIWRASTFNLFTACSKVTEMTCSFSKVSFDNQFFIKKFQKCFIHYIYYFMSLKRQKNNLFTE